MDDFLRTLSQFVYVLAVLVAVPSLVLLAAGLVESDRFYAGAILGVSLAELAAVAAVSTLTANAIPFLRPQDATSWMTPLAAALLGLLAALLAGLALFPLG